MSSDNIDALRHRLKEHRQKKRAGLVKPKRSKTFENHNGRTERCDVTGDELVTKEGLAWLHRLGQALIVSGVCYDSLVDSRAGVREHVAFGLQRALPTNPPRPGLWEWFQIPVGAINNMDTGWVVKKILEPKACDLVFTEFFRK